jgi:hypothetical protein
MEERPLPKLGSEVVLLVWIGDQSVVRGHHGNVQVDEILQERRFVGSGISSRYYELLALISERE